MARYFAHITESLATQRGYYWVTPGQSALETNKCWNLQRTELIDVFGSTQRGPRQCRTQYPNYPSLAHGFDGSPCVWYRGVLFGI